MFFIAAFVYIICGTIFNLLASGSRQPWDGVETEAEQKSNSVYCKPPEEDIKKRKNSKDDGTTI